MKQRLGNIDNPRKCEHGPVLAVYPEGVWYTYVDADDVNEIIHEHIIGGRVVERLKI